MTSFAPRPTARELESLVQWILGGVFVRASSHAGRNRQGSGVRDYFQPLRQVIHQLGLVQLDYVNVLIPAHYQVFFPRLGPYEKTQLDRLVYQRGEFTEQWAHEASIIPMESWPLLHFRREERRLHPYGFESMLKQHPGYADRVLEEIRLLVLAAFLEPHADSRETADALANELHMMAKWLGLQSVDAHRKTGFMWELHSQLRLGR